MSSRFSHERDSIKRTDELCDLFEQACRKDVATRIEKIISLEELEQLPRLFAEILRLEMEYRQRAGEIVTEEEYLTRFPAQRNDIAMAFVVKEEIAQLPTITRQIEFTDTSTDFPNTSGELIPQIKGYRIIKKIGHGGMGIVFQAEQIHPIRRTVAIKVINCQGGNKDIVSRFKMEWQAMALMKHPSIARVFDAGLTDDQRPFFTMELIDGEPITVFCNRKQLTLDDRLNLFRTVCMAVHHAHRQGILHRDLKPNNILVTQGDREPLPKVIDFGLAKSLMPENRLSDQTLVTEEGRILGTLEYMSPEQAEGTPLTMSDTRTDVYSLGLVLYRILTGHEAIDKKAWRNLSLEEILRKIREDEPRLPSQVVAEQSTSSPNHVLQMQEEKHFLVKKLHRDLDWIIARAISKDPDRRYQSAEAFADDIERFQLGDSILARPPSFGYRIQKSFRKNRGKFIAGITVFLALLMGFFSTWAMYLESVKEKQNAIVAKDNLAIEIGKVRIAEQSLAAENKNLLFEKTRNREANQMLSAQLALNAWQAGDVNGTRAYYERAEKLGNLSTLEWRLWMHRLNSLPKPKLVIPGAIDMKYDPISHKIFTIGNRKLTRVNAETLGMELFKVVFFDSINMSLSADGRNLAIRGMAASNGTKVAHRISIFDTQKVKQVSSWEMPILEKYPVDAIMRFSPDKGTLFVLSGIAIEQWNIEKQALARQNALPELPGKKQLHSILDLQFDPDEQKLTILTNRQRFSLKTVNDLQKELNTGNAKNLVKNSDLTEFISQWKLIPKLPKRKQIAKSVRLGYRTIEVLGENDLLLNEIAHFHSEPPKHIALTQTMYGTAFLLATASKEDQVKVWFLQDKWIEGQVILNGDFKDIRKIEFISDQKLAILNAQNELFLADLKLEADRNRIPGKFKNPQTLFHDFAVSRNHLISFGFDGEIETRNITNGETIFRQNCQDQGKTIGLKRAFNSDPWTFLYASGILLNPSADLFMTRLPNGTVQVWKTKMEKPLHSIRLKNSKIIANGWHGNGILFASERGDLYYDRLNNREKFKWNRVIAGRIGRIASDPNSELVVICGIPNAAIDSENSMAIFRIPSDPKNSSKLKLPVNSSRDPVYDALFCDPAILQQDGGKTGEHAESILVTAHQSGKVRFWNIPSKGKETVDLIWEWNVSSSSLYSIEIIPEEFRLLAADQQGVVRMLNIAKTPNMLLELTDNTGRLSKKNRASFVKIRFDRTGNRIIALDDSGHLLQWSLTPRSSPISR